MSFVFKSFNSMLSLIIDLLPDSPFRGFIDNLTSIPYLGYLNYFVPVGHFVAILTAWTACIATYYVLSAVLRTINAID